jgi:hypothetical protein
MEELGSGCAVFIHPDFFQKTVKKQEIILRTSNKIKIALIFTYKGELFDE